MIDPIAMYLVGVAHTIVCVAGETMRQIELGKMDIRALAVQRSVGRELLSMVATMPPGRDLELITARIALIAQTVAYVAYLDALENHDDGAAKQKRSDYDAAAVQLTAAIVVLVEHSSEILDRASDGFLRSLLRRDP